MLRKTAFAVLILASLGVCATAQDLEVDRYDVNVRLDAAAGAADVQATVSLVNAADSSKSRLYFRLSKEARVSAVTVNQSAVQYETPEDRRTPSLQQVIVSPPTALAPNARVAIDFAYRLEIPDSSPLMTAYHAEAFFFPEATWVPMPSTVYALGGPMTAPISLTVRLAGGGLRVASGGSLKADEASRTFTFEQKLNSLPFFVASSFQQVVDLGTHGGVKLDLHLLEGLAGPGLEEGDSSGDVTSRMADEARHIIDFLTRSLGPAPPGAGFRIIASARAGNVAVPGALVLNERVFRRSALGAGVVELLADGLARVWLDGRVRVRGREAVSEQPGRPGRRGQSYALLRDSLPRYFALLYFEERFGEGAARQALARTRWAYTPVARSARDAELGIQTLAISSYGAAAYQKGPLVLRLMAKTAGRDKFLAAVRTVFSGGPTRVVTTEDLRSELVKSAGPPLEMLFQQWVDSIVEPDIIVGTPLPGGSPGTQRVNLRNLGTGDVTVPVVAVTESGKNLVSEVTVPSENATFTEFRTDEKIVSVEVDPEKLVIQTGYDNDAKPPYTSAQTLFNESVALFNRAEYAEAEAKLREGLRRSPDNALLRAWLARALLSQEKVDDAATEAEAVLKVQPPLSSALTWARITLGQVAMRRGKAAEAVRHLRIAMAEADETPAQIAVREALAAAEKAEGAPVRIEDSVRAWVAQFDSLMKQPASDRLFTLVVRSNLKRFVQGITINPPSAWATQPIRTETLDANRVALDVALRVTVEGRAQQGTALFVLVRAGGGWMLEDVPLFNVN